MRQTIEVWLEDKPGALMRVAGVLTAKGCNITSIKVEPARKPRAASHMLLVADVEPRLQVKVLKEINRLVNVLRAVDISDKGRLAC
jgi:acetolactate synthase-1/3 small subunit